MFLDVIKVPRGYLLVPRGFLLVLVVIENKVSIELLWQFKKKKRNIQQSKLFRLNIQLYLYFHFVSIFLCWLPRKLWSWSNLLNSSARSLSSKNAKYQEYQWSSSSASSSSASSSSASLSSSSSCPRHHHHYPWVNKKLFAKGFTLG